jgi:prolyl-tRNA editing enzyme YbaK/EbsC (Cys-tRNA(Pro) deacylase)
MVSTRITRYLDKQSVPYRILPHAQPVFTVEAAAAQRGVILSEMVKSILLREKKGDRYVMSCVPGGARLDPQAVRVHLEGDWKRLSFASADEIQRITGYLKGAVAPLCLPEAVPVIFDESLARCQKVNISSGDPMAGLELPFRDLLAHSRGVLAPITSAKA